MLLSCRGDERRPALACAALARLLCGERRGSL